jgi:chromosome partitioning protein
MTSAATNSRDLPEETGDVALTRDGEALSTELRELRQKLFPPNARKSMRKFTNTESAKLIGISDAYLRQLVLEGKGPSPSTTPTGRKSFTLEQINDLRRLLSASDTSRRYVPHRSGEEKCQVVACSSFKGGIGKTIHSTHLAQYLALRGYRVLAIDLDPQGSMSSMFGYHSELDDNPNDSLWGALRYDDERVEIETVVRQTYVDGLHLLPASIHLQEFEHETAKALADRLHPKRGGAREPFFRLLRSLIERIEDNYDFVICDCPPQLGYITLSALCSATALIIPVHPQMLDVSSTSQYLIMAGDLLSVFKQFGSTLRYDFIRYLITRYEPTDLPQAQMVTFMQKMFGDRVLKNPMVKTTAISDAALSKQTLYEVERTGFTRSTYDRATDALNAVNGEIESLLVNVWNRQ